MKHALSDEELIRQYLTLQPTVCFDLIYKRYVDKVYAKCLSITKNVAQSEDFTQDIFIKVFNRLTTFQHRSSFSTWLYSITHNYCLDQLTRARRLTMTRFDERQEEWHLSDTRESLDYEEVMQQLEDALDSLPPLEQSLLRLKYQQKLSISDLASLYALNASGLKMRLMRSRTKVKQFCNRQPLQ